MNPDEWSLPQIIIVSALIANFVGVVAVQFYRTRQLEKRLDKHDSNLEKQLEQLETRLGKHMDNVREDMREIRQNFIRHLIEGHSNPQQQSQSPAVSSGMTDSQEAIEG